VASISVRSSLRSVGRPWFFSDLPSAGQNRSSLRLKVVIVVLVQLRNRGGNRHFDGGASIKEIGGVPMVSLSIRCDKILGALAGIITC
jgi:hypothetical protein